MRRNLSVPVCICLAISCLVICSFRGSAAVILTDANEFVVTNGLAEDPSIILLLFVLISSGLGCLAWFLQGCWRRWRDKKAELAEQSFDPSSIAAPVMPPFHLQKSRPRVDDKLQNRVSALPDRSPVNHPG